ncbi:MAG: Uma2 family endonuclease [Prochlorococcaceae cyanobacterium]
MTLSLPIPTFAPLLLPPGLRLTPEQFAAVCRTNPEAVLELGSDGQLITMTPTGGETGARNSRLLFLLEGAIRRSGLPLKLFDSSSGFLLPDGSVRSPDAAILHLERWQALSPEQRRGFPPLCPDLVVELASPSDELAGLRRKLETYRANGASLGWLLVPEQRAVEIWRADPAQPQHLEAVQRLDADELFPGFTIDLDEVWEV